MDAIIFWRIFLVLGSLAYLGASGIFTLKLIAAATGRKRILDFLQGSLVAGVGFEPTTSVMSPASYQTAPPRAE